MKKLISLLTLVVIGVTIPTVGINNTFNKAKNNNLNSTNTEKNKNFINKDLIWYKINQIPFTNIKFLFDNQDNAWVYNTDALYFIAANSFKPTLINSITSISSVQLDSQGNCWIINKNLDLFVVYSGTNTAIQVQDAKNIRKIFFDKHDRCWVIDAYNVLYSVNFNLNIPVATSVLYYALDFMSDNQGNCWVNNGDGLFFIAADSILPVKIQGFQDDIGGYYFALDSQGNCWVGYHAYYYVAKGTIQAIKLSGITVGEYYKIKIDKEDNAWIYSDNLLYMVSADLSTTTSIPVVKRVSEIYPTGQGGCWVFTIEGYNNGLYYVAPGSASAVKISTINYITNVYLDSKGNCWFYYSDGLYLVTIGSTSAIKVLSIILPKYLIFDQQGNCWAVDNASVLLYFIAAGSTSSVQISGITGSGIANLQVDSQGNAWFYNTKGLYYVAAGLTTSTIINNASNINSFQIDNKENIWIYANNTNFMVSETYNEWIKTNLNLSTEKDKNLIWLKSDQIASNGLVELKTTDQEINTIKVDNQIIPRTNNEWDFIINDNNDKNHNYNIELDINVQENNYNITLNLSSLLTKPILNVKEVANNETNLKPIWFQKTPNSDLKHPSLINEAFLATSTVELSLPNPTETTIETGLIYGLNSDFTRTSQSPVAIKSGDKQQITEQDLDAVQGLFEVDVNDEAGNNFTYYLQINTNPTISNFFDTDQGQYFVDWATKNGYTNEDLNDLQKADDSDTFNTIIENSKNWVPLATFQEYADKLENMLKNIKIKNSQTGLTQFDLRQAISSQITSTLDIQGEDTTAFDKSSITITIDPPKNGKTYQDNEKVIYNIDYNGRIASTTSSIIVAPYNTPGPSSVSKYLWLIILLSCVVGFGLIFLLVYYLWLKKLITNKKPIKN